MTWVNENLVVEQGSQLVKSWLFFNDGGAESMGNPADYVPFDFTGATLKMQVRQTEDATSTLIVEFGTATGEFVFISGTIVPGPPAPSYNNGYRLTIVAATSLALPKGNYWFDIFMTQGGVPIRIDAGTFEVVATQTR